MNMYKEVYLMLFNRISIAMENIERIVDKTRDKELKDIVDYLKETQCAAEEFIISSEEKMEKL